MSESEKYGLTIDESERNALVAILSDCKHEQLSIDRNLDPAVAPLVKWDADWNGQITCDELRKKGVETLIGPDHEGYPFVSDANCDGKLLAKSAYRGSGEAVPWLRMPAPVSASPGSWRTPTFWSRRQRPVAVELERNARLPSSMRVNDDEKVVVARGIAAYRS